MTANGSDLRRRRRRGEALTLSESKELSDHYGDWAMFWAKVSVALAGVSFFGAILTVVLAIIR